MLAARFVSTMVAGAAGRLLTVPFYALAALRRGKPIHSRGTVFDATVRRHGSGQRWGAAWLDEPGEDHGLARISKSAGLPEPLPDVWGLALTFDDDTGVRHDLLVASTGLAPGLRHVLIPRRDPRQCTYTTLLPYNSPQGPALIAAVPFAPVDPAVAAFRLLAAGLASAWHPFGSLQLTERPGASGDEPVRFDPVLFPLPEMWWAEPLARIREPPYVAARRHPLRDATPGQRAEPSRT